MPKNSFEEKHKYWKEYSRRVQTAQLHDSSFLYDMSKIGHTYPVEIDFLFRMIESGDKDVVYVKSLFFSGEAPDSDIEEPKQSFRKFRA